MKPGIQGAVLLAGFTGMVMAQRGWPDGKKALICLSSIFLSAAGSAVINGILDYPFDLAMARLEKRVAALESVGKSRALAIALVAISIAFILSIHYLGYLVFLFIMTAVLFYTILYTLQFKRRSPWGMVPGGIPGALPALIGYAAVSGTVRLDSLILFTLMLIWQPPHFWSLSLEYQEDYRNAGLPVLPVSYCEGLTKKLIFICATALLPISLLMWTFGFCTLWYAGAAIALGIFYFISCCYSLLKTGRCRIAFSASIIYLVLLFVVIIVDVCLIQGRLS